jgi:AraC-like DNA-binding protein
VLSTATPLSRFSALDTRSPDEARDVIGRIFCPHVLSPAAARPHLFHARHNTAEQAEFSVNFVAYGAGVDIDPGELSRFFLLQIPVAGAATVRCGAREVEAVAGERGSLLSPTLPTKMHWRDGCEKIIVLIRRRAVEDHARALGLGRGDRVEFAPGVDLHGAFGRALARHVGMMVATAEEPEPATVAYQTSLRDGLLSLLFAHIETGAEGGPPRGVNARAVRRAEAFIAARADGVIAMTDVAREAGVCLRSLQESFKRSRGMTLSEWVQRTRLERFRAALLDPGAPETVSEIALSAGLGHFGRAAAAYRATYGETPGQTLKRRRG